MEMVKNIVQMALGYTYSINNKFMIKWFLKPEIYYFKHTYYNNYINIFR